MTKLAAGVIAVVLASATGVQAAPSAQAVLADVQHFYAGAHQLSAGFRQTVHNATFDRTSTREGQLWVLEPGDFRWDYRAHRNGRVVTQRSFVFDGTTLWIVD